MATVLEQAATVSLPEMLPISRDEWKAEMRRPEGKRFAFISADEFAKVANIVKVAYTMKDVDCRKWFEIHHTSLPPVKPGGYITVVDGSLSPIEERPKWPEDGAVTGCLITGV